MIGGWYSNTSLHFEKWQRKRIWHLLCIASYDANCRVTKELMRKRILINKQRIKVI